MDGTGPNDTALPAYEIPEQANPECADVNPFPDKVSPAEPSRAMQVILNVPKWDKFGFEDSKEIQEVFLKGVFENLKGVGFTGTFARVFNVDNSVFGAGVKTRLWFPSQADCICWCSYLIALRNQNPNNEIVDLSYYNTTALGNLTIRMVTNPQSKCHKWATPESVIPQDAFINGYVAPSNVQITPKNQSDPQLPLCEDYANPPGTIDVNNVASLQLIYSLPAFYKKNVTESKQIQYNVLKAWSEYLYSASVQKPGQLVIQIKALDNSASGAGVHTRLHFSATDKDICTAIADATKWDGKSEQDVASAKAWLEANVFGPYANNTLQLPGYFGEVYYRASMQACKEFASFNYPNSPGRFDYETGFVGTQIDIKTIKDLSGPNDLV